MAGWAGGVFTRARNWATDKLNLINPQAALFDQEDDNFATGLNNCITKDGTNKPSANMDWNAFRLTNMADATANTDAATYRQSGLIVYKSSSTGRTSTTTLADDPALLVALAAGTWAVEMYIPVYEVTGGSGAGGLKWQFAFSGTATNPNSFANWGSFRSGVTATTTSASTNSVTQSVGLLMSSNGTVTTDWIRVSGTITVTVAGNLTFKWAQNTSDVNATTVAAGAWIKAWKVV